MSHTQLLTKLKTATTRMQATDAELTSLLDARTRATTKRTQTRIRLAEKTHKNACVVWGDAWDACRAAGIGYDAMIATTQD